MEKEKTVQLREICAALSAQRLPRWRELPDLELYMDQVLSLIGRYLGTYPGFDGKGLTASMVNNYVKLGIMPAPVKKKYARPHLAHLLIICILKTCLPIAAIQQLIGCELAQRPIEEFYDGFCGTFEQAAREAAASHMDDTAETAASPLCRAALRAQAEQALALKLAACLGGE